MPLQKGKGQGVISKNIEEMVASGHPQKVAVAAALHNADQSSGGKGAGFKAPKPMKGKK